MQSGLERIFPSQLSHKQNVLVLLYLYLSILFPRVFHLLVGRFSLEKLGYYLLHTAVIVFGVYLLNKKLKNIHVIIVIISAGCALLRFLYELSLGKGFYIGVNMMAVYSIVLLYSWYYFWKRIDSFHFLAVLVLGFFFSELSIVLTRFAYIAILEEEFINTIRGLLATIHSTLFYSVFATGLFFVFGLNKYLN